MLITMRIIYSTPRLENAERVAKLMEAEGIGVRLLFGPQFRRNRWRSTDYRQTDDPGHWPRVLVLNNGDLPKARAVLRSAGLMAPASFDRGEDPSSALQFRPRTQTSDPARFANRIRVALIAILMLVILVQGVRALM